MKCMLILIGFFMSHVAMAAPKKEEENAKEQYVQKINFLCGSNLTIEYDEESLKKNNKDIGWGQNGGSKVCNEPLRYVWYGCQTAQGKAIAKKIKKVRCQGIPGKVGSLTFSEGVVTVSRAYEDYKHYLRAVKQFESIFKTKIKLGDADPYHDTTWTNLRWKPNPVTDTKNYCLQNGKKVKFDQDIISREFFNAERRKESGSAKCIKNGKPFIDVKFVQGKKSGFVKYERDESLRETHYKAGEQHGSYKEFSNGRLERHSMYQAGKEIWQKEYHKNGKLKSYWKPHKDGRVSVDLHDNGKIDRLTCRADLEKDRILAKICGFKGMRKVKTYNRSGDITGTYVYLSGEIQSQSLGAEHSKHQSAVKFKKGKKNGVEKIKNASGKVTHEINWKAGQKHGKETEWDAKGRKLKIMVWSDGILKEKTGFFLNGKPKNKEKVLSRTKRHLTAFHDNGQKESEGKQVQCGSRYYKSWCDDGKHKSYFEDGSLASETQHKSGDRDGVQKYYSIDGKISTIMEYEDGRKTSRKEYDSGGSLTLSEEYLEDGSRISH